MMNSSIRFSTVTLALLVAGASGLNAQLSQSAYRVLGQPDFRQDGINGVQGGELFGPSGIAIALRGGQLRLFLSDTQNHRVLGWADARAYQNGVLPDLVLGQPGFQS